MSKKIDYFAKYDFKINSNELLPLIMTIKSLSIIQKIIINQEVTLSSITPNDPMCNNTNTNYQSYLNNIDHFNALGLMPTVNNEGDCNTRVAIIDNGFNFDAPELNDPNNNVKQVWHNNAEDDWTNKSDPTTGNGIDDDNNGYIDDWVGWHFNSYSQTSTSNNDPRLASIATIKHGTPIAHIVGAKANNNNQMAGISGGWDTYDGVDLMFVNIASDYGGKISTVDITYGLQYARINAPRIISMSFCYSVFDQAIEDELQACYVAGIFLVGASGNSYLAHNPGPFWTTAIQYPAASKYVFSVGATDNLDVRWGSSCYAGKPEGLDLVAPGGTSWINTIEDNGNNVAFNGTSSASGNSAKCRNCDENYTG